MEQGGRGGQRLFNGEAVYSASLTVQEFPGKSAKDGFSFRADVRSDGLLQVDGFMRDGQRWTVSVYRDLPPFLEVGPFACAVVGLLASSASSNPARSSRP